MRGPYPAPLEAHPLSGCAKEPFRGGKPPRDGVLALAFHTLLSFQGTSPGCSSATHLRFPCRVAAGAAGTVPRAFQDRQRPPTCPVSVLLVEHHPPRRHLHTEAPPCARP